MQVLPVMLIGGSKTIAGHASGHSGDSEDTLGFSALAGVRPMIETLPLEQAEEAYDRMMSRRRALSDGAHDRRLSARAAQASRSHFVKRTRDRARERGAHERREPGDRRGEADVVDEARAAAGCGANSITPTWPRSGLPLVMR